MDLLFTVWRWTFSWRFVLKLKTKKIYLSRKFFLQVLLLLVSLDTLNCQWALAKKNCFLLFLFFFFSFWKVSFLCFLKCALDANDKWKKSEWREEKLKFLGISNQVVSICTAIVLVASVFFFFLTGLVFGLWWSLLTKKKRKSIKDGKWRKI